MKVIYLFCITLIIQLCGAPPVSQKKEDHEDSQVNSLEDYMEYGRYLKEIVNALESDVDFRAKLENAKEEDIKSGRIAEELEFVSHHVRTRLDELKRVELERLRQLVEQKKKLEDPNAIDNEDPLHHHLDRSNPHTFEIEDLKKLIAKTTADLAEADRKRKEEFKQYELEKEYKKLDKLNHTNGDERVKLEKEYKEMEEKHKKHEKLHEPGHKAQLEEVWEEQDQMQQDFDPKTFFMLHDIDGNGLWDQDEVKALFINELNKMYQEGAPEDDLRERYEEMERMRESVYKEMDTNHDGFIDFNEFIRQTNSNDFKQDHGWQGLDEQRPFSDEELANYVRQHQAMNQIPQGYPQGGYQQHGYQQNPQGYQQNPQGYQQHPQEYQQVPHQGYQQHPQGYQQVPQGYQQAPQGYQQAPQGYQQQVPQGYQVPQGSQGYQQVPQVNQQNSQGYQQVPQGNQQRNPQQGHQEVPKTGQHPQVPQGQQPQVPHGQQPQAPQGQQHQVPQGQQPQVPQGQQQVPQGQQPQVLQGHHQVPPEKQQRGDLNTNEVQPPQNVPQVPQELVNEINKNDQH